MGEEGTTSQNNIWGPIGTGVFTAPKIALATSLYRVSSLFYFGGFVACIGSTLRVAAEIVRLYKLYIHGMFPAVAAPA